jgi:ABC-type multidrug transport system ATPase subunit
VSGEFRGGELSAILGQSGSGKTSLLNILSGYKTKNVSGSIEMPKKNFKVKYIMQDDANYHALTVSEAMQYSLKFKIRNIKAEKCHENVRLILERLGISHTMNHLIYNLSSGEQRRLSIGLELIDDPKVLFLDEPITGLDSSSSLQCIKLLKNLASEGTTIICTIHQPSSLILKIFDHVYAMSNGCCIYQGSYENLITFLTDLKHECPNTYNPMDYLLEISAMNSNKFLVDHIRNGKNFQYRGNNNNKSQLGMIDFNNDAFVADEYDPKTSQTPSFSARLKHLISRTMLLTFRDKNNVMMRVTINLLVGLLIGILYRRKGNDANEILTEYKFLFMLCGFSAYSGFYSLMVKCA